MVEVYNSSESLGVGNRELEYTNSYSKSRNRQSGVACWSIKLDISSRSKNFAKSSESELGVRSPRSASVLESYNEMITGLTCSCHFGMNRLWDFLIRRSFYGNTFSLHVLIVYVAPSFL